MRDDYLNWQSDLSLNDVFAQSEAMSYPTLIDGGLLYLSSLSEEGGRLVLVYKQQIYRQEGNQEKGNQGQDTQQTGLCITPAPFSLRTRINEYGGKPFWLNGNELVFSNDHDGCLYRQQISDGVASKPERITTQPPEKQRFNFAEVLKLKNDSYLAVVEHQSPSYSENECFLALIDCRHSSAEPQRLFPKADFFSNLVVNANVSACAWVQWDHPNMPWDATQLWVAQLDRDADGLPCLADARQINLPDSASVCQLMFAHNDLLYFVVDYAGYGEADSRNFWNIASIDVSSEGAEEQRVTQEKLEFGYPHWQYSDLRLVQADEQNLIAVGSGPNQDFLFKIDATSSKVQLLDNDLVFAQNLSSNGCGQVAMLAKYLDRPPAMIALDAETGSSSVLHSQHSSFGGEEISKPAHMSFATDQNKQAYGFYYPPKNPRYENTEEAKRPPLLVMVHGGPTARAYGVFDLQKQFWTQRGFAIVDVNHRGSNGYGRAFRDALYGRWGEDDCTDVIAAIDYLVEQGLADSKRVCIRGKSAGGYAVLRALTEHPDRFSVGACYYGIGNLVTLAMSTHKFEAHYTDRLIDEKFDPASAQNIDSKFKLRSPITNVKKLQSAMIVFQGSLDKVVPPAVAHEMIKALQKQNIPHKYVEYADEAHGFRQVANNIDAWQLELDFYLQHL